MANRPSTVTWEQVLAIAGRKASRGIQDDLGAYIANLTLNWVNDKYDFRWTLKTLPPFYGIPSEQDYGAPAVIIPSDFYGLRWANLVRTDNMPPYRQPLAVIKDLLLTHARYLPHAICYVTDRQAFRLFPRFPDNVGSPTYLIEGQYKFLPPKITAETLATTLLPSDDVYMQMWIETAKWAMWQTDSDPRAGQITDANGQISANGQAAVMMQMIDWVASREGLELGDPVVSPAEPLVTPGPFRPNMLGLGFGWVLVLAAALSILPNICGLFGSVVSAST
jgi:hypothetical protein